MNETRKTIVLGVVFLLCLTLAYFENALFFTYLADIFSNPLSSMLVLFVHNVLVVSLIMVTMTFCVNFVLTFLPKRKYEFEVLENPRLFAFIFTVIILVISILRTSDLVCGTIS